MDVKGEVLLQLINKSKLRKETKTFLMSKFSSIVKFKKLVFSAPLSARNLKRRVQCFSIQVVMSKCLLINL